MKGWIIWEPISRKFITSRDVIFNEDLLINDYNEETSEKETTLFDPFLLSAEILGLVTIITIFLNFEDYLMIIKLLVW
jgi:hypothetical protein